MKKVFIHVVLPASFVDMCISKGVKVADALTSAYGASDVHFKVDVVPDDYFHEFNS